MKELRPVIVEEKELQDIEWASKLVLECIDSEKAVDTFLYDMAITKDVFKVAVGIVKDNDKDLYKIYLKHILDTDKKLSNLKRDIQCIAESMLNDKYPTLGRFYLIAAKHNIEIEYSDMISISSTYPELFLPKQIGLIKSLWKKVMTNGEFVPRSSKYFMEDRLIFIINNKEYELTDFDKKYIVSYMIEHRVPLYICVYKEFARKYVHNNKSFELDMEIEGGLL